MEPNFALSLLRETQEIHLKRFYNRNDVTLLQANLALVHRHFAGVKNINMFIEKPVLTMSDGKRHLFIILSGIGKWEKEFVDSECNEIGHFRSGTFQRKRPHPHIQRSLIKLSEKTLKPVEKALKVLFTSNFVCFVKTTIIQSFSQNYSATLGNLLYVSMRQAYQLYRSSNDAAKLIFATDLSSWIQYKWQCSIYVHESIKDEMLC